MSLVSALSCGRERNAGVQRALPLCPGPWTSYSHMRQVWLPCLGCQDWGGWATGIEQAEARVAATIPTMHRPVPTARNCLAPNTSGAGGETLVEETCCFMRMALPGKVTLLLLLPVLT